MAAALLCAVLAQSATGAQPAPAPASAKATGSATLAAIRQRGRLRCGTSAGLEGFGEISKAGRWSGFDIDFCRALAAAIFDDPDKVDFVPLTAAERFSSLRQGQVDVLSRTTTWTLSREADNALLFAGVTYYDGQGFLVRKSLGITAAENIPSNRVCVQQYTTTELNLSDFFRERGLSYKPQVFASAEGAEMAFRAGKCGAFTADGSALFALRASLAKPDDHLILPQIISKEPLGLVVRQGDDDWFLIVRWMLIVMIDAEQLGVDIHNVDTMTKSENPRIRRLIGLEGNFGQSLGLSNDFAYRIVKLVGNYSDVFERNLGNGSRLKIKRGLNSLWIHGGLLFAPPLQ